MFNREYSPFAAAALMLMASMSLCPAQETTQPPVKPEIREAWHKSMVNISPPTKGCFTASYPDQLWHEFPCSTAKPFPPQPQVRGGRGGGSPALVGGLCHGGCTNDF